MASNRTEETVLELGCGQSKYSKYFPNRIAVDIVKRGGVDIVADSHHLPFISSRFSTVMTTEMLEHVHDPQRVVNEIERVLQPGGRLILTTRFLYPIHEAPFDYYRFTKYGLAHLFRNWSDVDIRADTSPFEGIGVMFQVMTYQSDFHGSKLIAGLCLMTAQILRFFDRLIIRQYGNYNRSVAETQIITSGYYVVAYRT